jgi:putative FmdB family regulatory protein
MPTYGYKCTRCDNAFEIVQRITDPALSICEQCGGELRKKIFPVGIAFKGPGFYVNDYGKSNGHSSAMPAPASESKAAAPVVSESKVDSKTDSVSSASSPGADTKTPVASAP